LLCAFIAPALHTPVIAAQFINKKSLLVLLHRFAHPAKPKWACCTLSGIFNKFPFSLMIADIDWMNSQHNA